jgi:CxxC motif-containing protein (DUF1111 family)
MAATASARPGGDEGRRAEPAAIELGRSLFLREWTPGVPTARGGDGLGPVYNDTSCVACHNQGGTGGAGSAGKNVDLVTAVVTPAGEPRGLMKDIIAMERKSKERMAKILRVVLPKTRAKGEAVDRRPLVKLHEGFGDSASIVLHRFGSGRAYDALRRGILNPRMGELLLGGDLDDVAFDQRLSIGRDRSSFPNEHGHFTLIVTERNPTPLFGVGLIEGIPDDAIRAGASRPGPKFPGTNGRVGYLKDGRIGRFGWKAQAASLDDFVRTACAVELGLEVPGHPQGRDPTNPPLIPAKLDLSSEDCDALTDFVRSLPRPDQGGYPGADEAARIREGKARFQEIGCVACHTPKLGNVDGLYSDLLLHDMGDDLADSGMYGRSVSRSADSLAEDDGLPATFPSGLDAFAGESARVRGASRQEWRTPPLWGLRDSGPYLHDGRAETLEQAIASHGGQGAQASRNYFRLTGENRVLVQAFLKSLVAPESARRIAQ